MAVWFFVKKKKKKFFICYDFYLYKIKKNNKIIKYVLRLLVWWVLIIRDCVKVVFCIKKKKI